MRVAYPLGVAILAIVPACGDSGSDLPYAGFDSTPDFDDTVATVEVFGSAGGTSLIGVLVTEPPPWPYDVEPVVGSCRYSTLAMSTCTPFCEYGEACIAGACVAQPPARSAGDLVFTGVGAARTVPF